MPTRAPPDVVDELTKEEVEYIMADRYWTSHRATLNEDIETFRKKKSFFWLNPPLLKIKEYTCTPTNKGKGFF